MTKKSLGDFYRSSYRYHLSTKSLRDISNRILALPMYPELTEDEQTMILDIIKKNDIKKIFYEK